jgi:hypothetical protein
MKAVISKIILANIGVIQKATVQRCVGWITVTVYGMGKEEKHYKRENKLNQLYMS